MGTSSKYLTHRVIPNIGATGIHLAEDVAAVLEEYNSVNTVKPVLVDNTSTNTGCKTGMVAALEKKIKWKVHTIGCSLHQNELPFRAVFKTIDGTTRSPTTFTGPLGKLCESNYHHLPQVKFERISGPLDNFYLPAKAMDDLSGDQRLLLQYTVGISQGKVNPRFVSWKI